MALCCYSVLRADPAQMYLRFVGGRPVSQMTTDYLAWLAERLATAGQHVLLLMGPTPVGPSVNRVRDWLQEHNRRAHTAQRAVASGRAE